MLKAIKENLTGLISLLNGNHNIGQVLHYLEEHHLLLLDDRFKTFMRAEQVEGSPIEIDEDANNIRYLMTAYFDIPVKQMLDYRSYLLNESAYSTQHSIKGAEFERVLVILDDEEGNSFYSYNKLFGVTELSNRDNENLQQGINSTPARTRRLLYVCCSRALRDFAVILFVDDPPSIKIQDRGRRDFSSS